ncbi:MAG: hypothetical protein FGM18_00020 [Burkholderiaceae bacterium]|nr:hypothetical protein [Burkholderiaceae bacterium]
MSADRESRSFKRDDEASDPMADHKRRARWRLLGALIITGVVAAIAPFLLEEQARPLSQDLLIEIPSKNSLFSKIDSLKPAAPEHWAEKSVQKPVESSKGESARVAPEKAEPSKADAPRVEQQSTEPKAQNGKTEPKKPETKQAEPKKSEPKAAEPKKPSDSGVFVQVGAYAKLETANAVKAKLTAGGHRVVVESIKLDDGAERHRVRIGPFETRDLANQVRDRAKSQGYDAMVVNP